MDNREEENKLNNDTKEKLNSEANDVDPSTKGRLMVEEGRKRRKKRRKLFDFGLNLLQFAIVAVFVILVVTFAKYKLDNDRKSDDGNVANNEKATNGDEDETGEGEK